MRYSKKILIISVIYFCLVIGIGIYFIFDQNELFYSAGAILLSAILALSAAFFNVYFQRRTAKDSNSLHFQQALSSDTTYLSQTKLIIAAIKNKQNIAIADYAKSPYNEDAKAEAIRFTLNVWERAANAMQHGIYDEEYLYHAHKSMVLYLGVHLREYIQARQVENISYYSNLNWLILKWAIRRDSFEERVTKAQLKQIFKQLNRIQHGVIPFFKK